MRAAILLTTAVLLGGCQDWDWSWWRRESAPAPAAARPTPLPPPPPAAAEVKAAAYVNGTPIPMDKLQELLLRSEGLSKAWLLITAELVRQEGAKRNVKVTDADLRAEEDESLEQAFAFLPQTDQRLRMLDRELQRRNISKEEWQIILRRNATVRKLAAAQARPSEAEMQEVFRDLYGPRVLVRHVQTNSLTQAQQILEQFRSGVSFGELAEKYSMNRTAREGGLLPAISETSLAVPPMIRATALSLQREGQVSAPVQVGSAYHILYLEKKIPAQNVTFQDVRPQVAAAAQKQKTQAVRDELLKELVRKARIVYLHPILQEQASQEASP